MLSANGQITFEKTIAGPAVDRANNSLTHPGGGYIISGSSAGSSAGVPYFIRLHENGDTLWTKLLGVSDNDKCRVVSSNNGFVVQGYTWDFGAGWTDAYLTQLDSNFNVLWTRSYGGTNHDFIWRTEPTWDDGYIMAGGTQTYGQGFVSAYLVKVDYVGDTLWSRAYGGLDMDNFSHAIGTSDSGYLAIGYTQSFGVIDQLPYLIKVDGDGNLEWSKIYTINGGGQMSFIKGISENRYLMMGRVASSSGSGALCLTMIDGAGEVVWSKSYSDPTFCGIVPRSVELTAEQDYIIAGDICNSGLFSDALLIKIDSNGTVDWARCYKSEGMIRNQFNDITVATDGGYLVVGEVGGFSGGDIFLVKTDGEGNSCSDSVILVTDENANVSYTVPNTLVDTGCEVSIIILQTGWKDNVIVDCVDSTTSISSNSSFSQAQVNVYPNPLTERMTFSIEGVYGRVEIVLYNQLGQAILSKADVSPSNIELDISMPSGVYYLEVIEKRRTSFGKVIIQN